MDSTGHAAICNHELVFSPALDHAAVCRRCGAIALISPRDGQKALAAIRWIMPGASPMASAGSPAAE
jgi:hypothetical protein